MDNLEGKKPSISYCMFATEPMRERKEQLPTYKLQSKKSEQESRSEFQSLHQKSFYKSLSCQILVSHISVVFNELINNKGQNNLCYIIQFSQKVGNKHLVASIFL